MKFFIFIYLFLPQVLPSKHKAIILGCNLSRGILKYFDLLNEFSTWYKDFYVTSEDKFCI